ncbi:MAG TPA: TadE family type IV pilus minor pilin [Kineosporiaceae bacterium]
MRGSRPAARAAGERGRRDAGSVTAEFAIALPAVMLVLALGLGSLQAALVQLRCVDAARAAARFAARGESDQASLAEARRLGPPGGRVEVAALGDHVRVRVAAVVPLPLGPAVTVAAAAVAAREQP